MAADEYGLHTEWVDARDRRQRVSERTLAQLRSIIGRPPADLAASAPLVTRPRRGLDLGRVGPVEVECEDGTARQVDGVLPDDFPLGYHRIRTAGPGDGRLLVVSPGRCWLPEGLRAWGFAVQLYTLGSRGSWGIGDLADLRAVREWAQSLGAGFCLINPLHAVSPTHPQEASPYLPVTRRFLNPIYLRVTEVPGAEAVDLGRYAEHAQPLRASPEIDRDAVWRLKRAALRAVFDAGGRADEAAAAWCAREGSPLRMYATWCALAEAYGADWRDWPEALRRRDAAGVAGFAAEHAEEVDFHAWLQWAVAGQLRAATGDLTVLHDLPIGVDGAGADAWAWQDLLAGGVRVGAPPDAFNPAGQDWGSPPLIPWRLRAAEYEPFIQSLRATMAGAGGIRIDHVMGLFRLWWVPEGGSSADGAYVGYPSEDLLDIVALESYRAQALVVGEDLGTVEPGVRDELAERGIMSYKVLWFEDDDPSTWPVSSMAAVTTHDLPTVAGLWTGSDLAEQVGLGLGDDDELAAGRDEILARLTGPAGLAADAPSAEAVDAAHRLLARAPSVLLAATLEDAVGEQRRPNIPGTTQRANWCQRLPVPVEDLSTHPGAASVAAALNAAIHPGRA